MFTPDLKSLSHPRFHFLRLSRNHRTQDWDVLAREPPVNDEALDHQGCGTCDRPSFSPRRASLCSWVNYSPILGTITTGAQMPAQVKNKTRSFLDFVKVKEPSQAALAQYAEAHRKQNADKAGSEKRQSRLENGQPKLPKRVPKVNSKWDGLPGSTRSQRKSGSREYSMTGGLQSGSASRISSSVKSNGSHRTSSRSSSRNPITTSNAPILSASPAEKMLITASMDLPGGTRFETGGHDSKPSPAGSIFVTPTDVSPFISTDLLPLIITSHTAEPRAPVDPNTLVAPSAKEIDVIHKSGGVHPPTAALGTLTTPAELDAVAHAVELEAPLATHREIYELDATHTAAPQQSHGSNSGFMDRFIDNIDAVSWRPSHARSLSLPLPTMIQEPLPTQVTRSRTVFAPESPDDVGRIVAASLAREKILAASLNGQPDPLKDVPQGLAIPSRKSSRRRKQRWEDISAAAVTHADDISPTLAQLHLHSSSPAVELSPKSSSDIESSEDTSEVDSTHDSNQAHEVRIRLPNNGFLAGEAQELQLPDSPTTEKPALIEHDTSPVPEKNSGRENPFRLQSAPARAHARSIPLEIRRRPQSRPLIPIQSQPCSPTTLNFSRPRPPSSMGSQAASPTPITPVAAVPELEIIPSSRKGSRESLVSIAPSELSVQWHQSPKDRLGLGGWIKKSEGMPWETEDNSQPKASKTNEKRNRRSILFGKT